MAEGRFLGKTTEQTGGEGIGSDAQNTDRVTKYLFGAGRGFEGGTPSAVERELQGGNTPIKEDNQWDTHALQRGILGMGNGDENPPPGGDCGGGARGGGLAGRGDGELWP